VSDEILVQVSYAIGVAEPVSIYVNTYGKSKLSISDGEIAIKGAQIFDLRPKAIEKRLKLRCPIYAETASYGHLGRTPEVKVKTFKSKFSGTKTMEVELFTWEKLDYVDVVKQAFEI
ncbi:MAG: methionine adenosyltransferase domain-containing protein, partial [Paludibacteraceae bacterium]|nr:methionine adenosyltransferase domain-containing protein [Paludibacteraceae bacterium]